MSNRRPVFKEGWAAPGGEHTKPATIHSAAGPGVAAKPKDGNQCGGHLHSTLLFKQGLFTVLGVHAHELVKGTIAELAIGLVVKINIPLD